MAKARQVDDHRLVVQARLLQHPQHGGGGDAVEGHGIAGRGEQVEAGVHPVGEGVKDRRVDPLGRAGGLAQAHVGSAAEIGVGGAIGEIEVHQRDRPGLGGLLGKQGGKFDGQGRGARAAHRAHHRPASRRTLGAVLARAGQHRDGRLGQLGSGKGRFQHVGTVELE